MISVAVVGPGAIGSTVAAWLALDEQVQVVVCARSPRDILRVESPVGMLEVDPPVLTDPATAVPVDWVLFAVKAYDTEAASVWLAGLVGPSTRVAVLQNGVEQVSRLLPYLPAEKIVPVVVDIPAERLADGVVRQGKAGTLVVPSGSDGEEFVDLFAHSPIAVSVTDDFVTAAWTKLCLNSAGAICAALRQPSGVAHQDRVAELIRAVVAETTVVGRAEGAVLSDDLPDIVVRRMRANPPLFLNSLVADRLAGRQTEVEARNGAVVRAGRSHGIPTPLNSMLTVLVGAATVEGFTEL